VGRTDKPFGNCSTKGRKDSLLSLSSSNLCNSSVLRYFYRLSHKRQAITLIGPAMSDATLGQNPIQEKKYRLQGFNDVNTAMIPAHIWRMNI